MGSPPPEPSLGSGTTCKAFGRIADPVDLRTTVTKAVDDYRTALHSVAEEIGRLEPDDALVQATRALEVQAATEAKPDDAREVVGRLSGSYQRLVAMMGLDDALSRHNITVQESGALVLGPEAGRHREQLRSMRIRLGQAQAWYAGAGHELEAIDAL